MTRWTGSKLDEAGPRLPWRSRGHGGAAMPRLEPKHPRAVRWAHWVNVPVLAVMIWSGLLIYWANDVYAVRAGGVTLFHFFPGWFYRVLGAEHGLAVGMAYHFTFMWFFAANGCFYVLYTLVSGDWRHLLPNRHTPREAWHVVLHDLGLRQAPPRRAKFNGAQHLAYTGVIVMGAGSLVTGLAIYKPSTWRLPTRTITSAS